MLKCCLHLLVVILASTLTAFAQGTIDAQGVYHPTEAQLAAVKRHEELLRHPTFIMLRLGASPRDIAPEQTPDSPPPYKVGDLIDFRLFITQSSLDNIVLTNFGIAYYEHHPKLIKDGEILPYSAKAKERVDRSEREPPNGSISSGTLVPWREYLWDTVDLKDWYEPLGPGNYQILVSKQFARGGDWVESNPVFFQVQARNPSPIPAGVKIETVLAGVSEGQRGKAYPLGSDVRVTVVAVNDSYDRIKIEVVDSYYGNRPQLFKDGRLVPYRDEVTSAIHSKDENPQVVSVTPNLFLGPHTKSPLEELNLTNWYGPLGRGSYRLINRHRFEIDGPWTADSVDLLFEVAPQRLPRKVPGE